jgi:RNA polymerase sigma-70 factor (sigma-E family)
MRSETDREYIEFVTPRLARLRRTAYLLCGDTHRADDIVQTTITELYVQWRRARRADNPDAYVHRMLVHRFLDEKRRPWSRVVLTDDLPERPATAAGEVEERDALTAALAQLPPGRRAVLVLRFLCDLSVEQTAEMLGCSVGNVKSQCARGLAAMREVLDGPAPENLTCLKGAQS